MPPSGPIIAVPSADIHATHAERRLAIERAWERYVDTGAVPEGVREEIVRSWRRSRETSGIDPGLAIPGTVEREDELAERRLRDDVLRIAQPVLRSFAERLDLRDHALAYFDGDGWMLSIDGDGAVVERLAEISFQPGTNWSETSAGTNGPGTSLAEARALEVFAAEHYIAAWQPWSCAAAPVFRPGEDRPAGIVDLTGPWAVRRRQALAMVMAIARAIQERVRAETSVRDAVIRYALRAARDTGDALVAVDARGRIVAVNEAADRLRLVPSGVLPLGLRAAVARVLGGPALGDVQIDPPDGPRIVASVVQHEETPVGAILRAAVPLVARRGVVAARGHARYRFDEILGRSPSLLAAVGLAEIAARNDLAVVVSGESGTGKELFAQSIHNASARRAGPFVAVNCGAIPEQLVEAELFGYEPGAFTGARREGNVGRFEAADGGTLFLDEVSELAPAAQAALLRVLQEREVVRLGGAAPRRVDVRIVSATNRPLDEETRAGRFRRDLYYRLNVLPIELPPLRDRGDDVALLAEAFFARAEARVDRTGLSFAPDALAALRAYGWPGNVRELRNIVLRAAAIAPQEEIGAADLLLPGAADATPPGAASRGGASMRGGVPSFRGGARACPDDEARGALLAAIESCGWNLASAARELGVSRMTLYRQMKRLGIFRADAP